jgi:RimJ/RimL family protein N-acetyltransferase
VQYIRFVAVKILKESLCMKNFIEIFYGPFYLRPLLEKDIEVIYQIWTNDHVRKYLFDNVIISKEKAEDEITSSVQSFEKYRYGLWGVIFENNTTLIGFAGYRNFYTPPELHLLYGLLPEYCGKGFASILAKIMIKYGFEELGFDTIIANTDTLNVASARVIEKAGMTFEKQTVKNDIDTIYYRYDREDYLSVNLQYTVRNLEKDT